MRKQKNDTFTSNNNDTKNTKEKKAKAKEQMTTEYNLKIAKNRHPKTRSNILHITILAPEIEPSLTESSLPSIIFQEPCSFYEAYRVRFLVGIYRDLFSLW